MSEDKASRYRFKILNPAHYLDALLFWSVYTSTFILILWLLTSEAKDVFRSQAASHVISLTTTTAAALSQESKLHSAKNLKTIDAVVQTNRPLLAGGAIYEVEDKEKLNPLILIDGNSTPLKFDQPAHLEFVQKALASRQPIFSDWSVLNKRNLPTWLSPAKPLEYSFIRLPTGVNEPPALLILAFNAPVIEESFLEVDRIAGFMVALSIVVGTCLSFAVRYRSIQRVKANREKLAAIQLLEKRGAVLNAVARSADRLLSQRDAENVLSDLLQEIRPQMEARYLYSCLQAPAASPDSGCLGACPPQDPVNLTMLDLPDFTPWREALRADNPIVESSEQWSEVVRRWADERKLRTLVIFPIYRGQNCCGLLVAEYQQDMTSFDSSFIDILRVTADLFSAALTQREHNERMIQSSKIEALGRMAGGVAHEFNNLLHIISGNLRRLDHSDKSDDQLVKKILAASDRGSAIVEQLLRATRQRKTNLSPCALNTLVLHTVELAERTLGPETRLLTELEPDLPLVMADEGQLQQVILNLLLNARDAQESRGTIHLRTYRQRNEIVCEVMDSGSGIPEANLEHIFDPFFTTKPPGEGTGLGLSTSKGILEQHQGSIRARNREAGGACFTLTLPIPKYLPSTVKAADSKPEVTPVTDECEILIADDEELCREVIMDILKDHGYTVHCASGGEEVLAIARAHRDRIRWVITDWTMPGLHGNALLEKLRAELPSASLIVSSGYIIADKDVPLMDGFIPKPFTPEMLMKAIRE